jgi:hypothetical protein
VAARAPSLGRMEVLGATVSTVYSTGRGVDVHHR